MNGYDLSGAKINYANIRFGDYFRTLMNEARRCSYIGNENAERMKKELGNVLAHVISDYTGDESTSLMQETANELFSSVLYCFDAFLMGSGSHEEAIAYMIDNGVDDIYYNGQQLLRRMHYESVGQLVRLKKTRINVTDKTYNTTLDEEIYSYIKRYDRKFGAHYTKRHFSYRPILGQGSLCGIMRMKKYLEHMTAENDFVARFDENTVQELCYKYSETHGTGYNETGVNICSLVLMNGVFASFAEKKRGSITLNESDACKAEKLFKTANDGQKEEMLSEALKSLCTKDNTDYIMRCLALLMLRINDAIENGCIDELIVIS